jgi:hypothetical protein
MLVLSYTGRRIDGRIDTGDAAIIDDVVGGGGDVHFSGIYEAD